MSKTSSRFSLFPEVYVPLRNKFFKKHFKLCRSENLEFLNKRIQALDYRLAGEALIERLLSLHSFTLSK